MAGFANSLGASFQELIDILSNSDGLVSVLPAAETWNVDELKALLNKQGVADEVTALKEAHAKVGAEVSPVEALLPYRAGVNFTTACKTSLDTAMEKFDSSKEPWNEFNLFRLS